MVKRPTRPTLVDENAGAGVEVAPDDFADPAVLQAKLQAHYLETDDPIVWRLIEG